MCIYEKNNRKKFQFKTFYLPIKLQSAKTSPLKTEKTTNRPCLAMTSKPCWTEAPCPVAKKIIVKLRYCEKVTIFEKISHFFWSLLINVKTSGRFFQVFMAFSENLNFTFLIFLKKDRCMKISMVHRKIFHPIATVKRVNCPCRRFFLMNIVCIKSQTQLVRENISPK